MKRISVVLSLLFAFNSAYAQKPPGGTSEGEALFKSNCAACHSSSMAGAPALGDKKAWAPIIAQGMSVIMDHATRGIRGMPPRGGSSLTDAQLNAVVQYMVTKGK